MARIKRAVNARKKKNKIFSLTAGYVGGNRNRSSSGLNALLMA